MARVNGALVEDILPFIKGIVYAMPIQKPHRSEAERYSVAVPNYGTIQSVSLYHFGHYGYTHNRLDGTKKVSGR